MDKITVNYNHYWDEQGYYISQTIKLSKKLYNKTNNYISSYYKISDDTYINLYGVPIDYNCNHCIYNTQLKLLKKYMQKNNILCDRIKTDRNTILIIY